MNLEINYFHLKWRVAVLFFLTTVGLAPLSIFAHGLTFTRVEALFLRPGAVEITIEYNLALVLPDPSGYYALTQRSAEKQQVAVNQAVPEILAALQLYAGDIPLQPQLLSFTLPQLPEAAFGELAQDKSAVLRFRAALPERAGPLRLVVPYDARVDHPVLFAAGNTAGIIFRTWVEDGTSDPFDWGKLAPRPTWYREFATYLALGFRHIVPEGVDHILFVLALFFLGPTWRKLIAQTTAFTIAHATTLFLSQYGVISVPSRYIEPLIALSIACIALENIFRPKLGPGRVGLVFLFGLIHGLGFASSLSEVQFPKNEFLVALLGFNLGVDGGQLFILALAFLAVGWFRNKTWFRARITVPCCLLIAATGLCWTIQRILI